MISRLMDADAHKDNLVMEGRTALEIGKVLRHDSRCVRQSCHSKTSIIGALFGTKAHEAHLNILVTIYSAGCVMQA